MKTLFTLFILFIFTSKLSASETVEIHLLDNLDDKRGYCLDIKGHKSKAKIEKGLQAHTCYSYQGKISIDQGFDKHKLMNSIFYIPEFLACMETEYNLKTSVKLKKCEDEKEIYFIFNDEGQIILSDDKLLCLTVSNKSPRKGKGGNPLHLMRDISLKKCSSVNSKFQLWSFR